ncbi:ParB/RepB/Spo0J family partition protein [Shigella flexneri]|uniref:ParB/RepB/Spo0J family partition protein n=1 Tax=Shigella flexneri TaxID=623 RepID=UPI003CE91B36|nr:ParB/RepB/Spo0J family partition protein [Escherichia coli]
MALDLSALEDKPVTAAAEVVPAGKPMEIPLADIEEDPNQPRTEFSAEAMAEMTASIKARGVRQPVSVRPHPSKPGKWMLNFGARRYRGSLAAGKETIPAFVDETSDDFDQVIENEQRDNLKPMELALFIQRKLDEGVKKAEIARKLGKDAAVVTQHLALIAPPACIEEIYRSGRCTSPKTLYELRALHDKFPEAVEEWCEAGEEVTRKGVAELAAILKGEKTPSPAQAQAGTEPGSGQSTAPGAGESLGHDQDNDGKQGGTVNDDQGEKPSREPKREPAGVDSEGEGASSDQGGTAGDEDRGELTSWPRGKAVSDPDAMKKPLLLVEYEGRAAAVLLNRRPTTPGLIRIRYEDGSGDDEVDAGRCKINLLTESEK